jgi:hypothetical protein
MVTSTIVAGDVQMLKLIGEIYAFAERSKCYWTMKDHDAMTFRDAAPAQCSTLNIKPCTEMRSCRRCVSHIGTAPIKNRTIRWFYSTIGSLYRPKIGGIMYN